VPSSALVDAVRRVARSEGLLLDRLHGGKAFAGLLADHRERSSPFTPGILKSRRRQHGDVRTGAQRTTISTWSGFENDDALRSNVSSSNFHHAEASFQMSFEKSLVYLLYPSRPRSVAK
jgi:hypothetical protein